jgi:TonB family protein
VKFRTATLALLLPAALAGCTSSRGSSQYADLEDPRAALEGLTGRACHYIARPPVPASLDGLTRPGTRGSILLWGSEAQPSDTIDISVRYGREGGLSWVRAIDASSAGSRVSELEQLLLESLQEQGPADWGMRIRLVGGSVERILPSVVCPPEQGAPLGHAMRPVGSTWEMQEALRVRVRDLEVLVELDGAGRILDVRLTRGTGSRLLDQLALDVARSYRYYPKLHDGMGVPSVIPIRLRTPRR